MTRSLKRAKRGMRRSELAQLRANMPFETYINLLHVAAVSGQLPRLDPVTNRPLKEAGELVPPDEIDTKSRLEILRLLVNKGIADLKVEEARPALEEAAGAVHDVTPDTVQTIDADKLQDLIDVDYEQLHGDMNEHA